MFWVLECLEFVRKMLANERKGENKNRLNKKAKKKNLIIMESGYSFFLVYVWNDTLKNKKEEKKEEKRNYIHTSGILYVGDILKNFIFQYFKVQFNVFIS